MRLDEAGEFGLLAELERRGLAQGIEHDAAQIGDLVVTQDTLVEGVHFEGPLTTASATATARPAIAIVPGAAMLLHHEMTAVVAVTLETYGPRRILTSFAARVWGNFARVGVDRLPDVSTAMIE